MPRKHLFSYAPKMAEVPLRHIAGTERVHAVVTKRKIRAEEGLVINTWSGVNVTTPFEILNGCFQ
jgi:hypothetical protein